MALEDGLTGELKKAFGNYKNYENDYGTKRKCYGLLGLKGGASEKDIETTFKKLARKYHPDKNKEEEEEAARKIFNIIGHATAVLRGKKTGKKERTAAGSGKSKAKVKKTSQNACKVIEEYFSNKEKSYKELRRVAEQIDEYDSKCFVIWEVFSAFTESLKNKEIGDDEVKEHIRAFAYFFTERVMKAYNGSLCETGGLFIAKLVNTLNGLSGGEDIFEKLVEELQARIDGLKLKDESKTAEEKEEIVEREKAKRTQLLDKLKNRYNFGTPEKAKEAIINFITEKEGSPSIEMISLISEYVAEGSLKSSFLDDFLDVIGDIGDINLKNYVEALKYFLRPEILEKHEEEYFFKRNNTSGLTSDTRKWQFEDRGPTFQDVFIKQIVKSPSRLEGDTFLDLLDKIEDKEIKSKLCCKYYTSKPEKAKEVIKGFIATQNWPSFSEEQLLSFEKIRGGSEVVLEAFSEECVTKENYKVYIKTLALFLNKTGAEIGVASNRSLEAKIVGEFFDLEDEAIFSELKNAIEKGSVKQSFIDMYELIKPGNAEKAIKHHICEEKKLSFPSTLRNIKTFIASGRFKPAVLDIFFEDESLKEEEKHLESLTVFLEPDILKKYDEEKEENAFIKKTLKALSEEKTEELFSQITHKEEGFVEKFYYEHYKGSPDKAKELIKNAFGKICLLDCTTKRLLFFNKYIADGKLEASILDVFFEDSFSQGKNFHARYNNIEIFKYFLHEKTIEKYGKEDFVEKLAKSLSAPGKERFFDEVSRESLFSKQTYEEQLKKDLLRKSYINNLSGAKNLIKNYGFQDEDACDGEQMKFIKGSIIDGSLDASILGVFFECDIPDGDGYAKTLLFFGEEVIRKYDAKQEGDAFVKKLVSTFSKEKVEELLKYINRNESCRFFSHNAQVKKACALKREIQEELDKAYNPKEKEPDKKAAVQPPVAEVKKPTDPQADSHKEPTATVPSTPDFETSDVVGRGATNDQRTNVPDGTQTNLEEETVQPPVVETKEPPVAVQDLTKKPSGCGKVIKATLCLSSVGAFATAAFFCNKFLKGATLNIALTIACSCLAAAAAVIGVYSCVKPSSKVESSAAQVDDKANSVA